MVMVRNTAVSDTIIANPSEHFKDVASKCNCIAGGLNVSGNMNIMPPAYTMSGATSVLGQAFSMLSTPLQKSGVTPSTGK